MHMHFVTCGNIMFYVAAYAYALRNLWQHNVLRNRNSIRTFYVAETDLVWPLLHVIMLVIQSENALINEAELIMRCGSN